MPKRIPLIAGFLIASTTAVYAVRPGDAVLNGSQFDAEAADYCQQFAAGALRRLDEIHFVSEYVFTPTSRPSLRYVEIGATARGEPGFSVFAIVTCSVSWTGDLILPLDFGVVHFAVPASEASPHFP